jgi:hypothetical protein
MGNTQLIDDKTDLVVDGFPRSANSYAEAAFAVSQYERDIMIASHTHAAAQIIEGTRRGLPTVLLYRDPDMAVSSLVENSDYHLDPVQLFREYATFYGAVLPVLDRVAFAPFYVATQDFSTIVERTNALFGTAFAVPVMDTSFRAEVNRWRDEESLARKGRPTLYSECRDPQALAARKESLARIRAYIVALQDPARRRAHDLFNTLNRAERDRHE